VFEEAVKILPYSVPFEYVLFGSPEDTSSRSYGDFVYQVHLKVKLSLGPVYFLLDFL
jgi:ionotropic glutamate receptor